MKINYHCCLTYGLIEPFWNENFLISTYRAKIRAVKMSVTLCYDICGRHIRHVRLPKQISVFLASKTHERESGEKDIKTLITDVATFTSVANFFFFRLTFLRLFSKVSQCFCLTVKFVTVVRLTANPIETLYWFQKCAGHVPHMNLVNDLVRHESPCISVVSTIISKATGLRRPPLKDLAFFSLPLVRSEHSYSPF